MYDLLFVCPAFSRKTRLGDQLGGIWDKYMKDNVKTKNFRSKFTLDFNTFITMCPNFMLVNDIRAAFHRILPKRIVDKDGLDVDPFRDCSDRRKQLEAA